MEHLYTRAVFFVSDVERSRRFYTEQLGFTLDWDSNDGVFQVSLFGFEVILNVVWGKTLGQEGHGRVFIGLEDNQGDAVKDHIRKHRIRTSRVEWGRPTLVMKDVDGNEIFIWLPHDDFSNLGDTHEAS